MERIIGYREIIKKVIVSRPTKWVGQSNTHSDGFEDLPPVIIKKTLLEAIYEPLGAHVHTTMEDPLIGIPETPLWGINTDDATGKHKHKKEK